MEKWWLNLSWFYILANTFWAGNFFPFVGSSVMMFVVLVF